MIILRVFLILSFALGLLPDLASAGVPTVLQSFTTWGDFSIIVNTFERLALLMSDNSYQGLFAGFIVISIVFGVIGVVGKGLFSGKVSAAGWLTCASTVILGVMIYVTFIKPTSQITIYDEVLNQQKTVGGVPDGIVLVAGLANLFETGAIDLIWTSSNPDSYRSNAGGTVFNILHKSFQGDIDLSATPNGGRYINKSIQRYTEDCLIFELSRPGSTLDLNDIYANTDFRPHFAKAANPAKNTIWYDDSNKAGSTVTCDAAWTNLNTYFTSLTENSVPVLKYWEERCKRAGYSDVSGAAGQPIVEECRQIATNFVGNIILGAGVTSSQLMIQHLLASELFNVTKDSDAGALANRNAGSSMSGMATMGNQWIPVIRGVIIAIFLSMFPFACLLIPTPLFRQSLSFMLGTFVFLTSWGICDAIVHSFAMDKGIAMFQEIANGQLGYKSMMMFEGDSAKALAAFGAARWSSMMIASIVAQMLVRFGGSGMAHLAGQLAFRQQGAAAAETVTNPSRRAGQLEQLRGAIPSQTISGEHKFNELQAAETYRQKTAFESNLGGSRSESLGRTSADRASTSARANVTNMEKTYGETAGLRTAHQNAVDKGYNGSLSDYVSGPAKIGAEKGFINEKELQLQADKHTGGDTAKLLGMHAELEQSKSASHMANIKEKAAADSLTISDIGATLGLTESIFTFEQYAHSKQIGTEGLGLQKSTELYNRTAPAAHKMALDDIGRTGSISNESQNLLERIEANPVGRSVLSTMAPSTKVIKPQEAANFAKFLGAEGQEVQPESLSNATASMSLWTDEEGNLHNSFIASNKGETVASRQINTSEMNLTADQVEEITGMQGPAGHYTIHSTPTGDIVAISGAGGFTASAGNAVNIRDTSGGYLETATVSPETGEVVTSRAEFGPAVTPPAMSNAAILENEGIANRLATAPTTAAFLAEGKAQAEAFSKDLASIVTKQGLVSNYSSLKAIGALSAGTPLSALFGSSAYATSSAGIGRDNREQRNYDLYYGLIRNIQDEERLKATDEFGTVDQETFSSNYMQRLNDLVKETDDLVKGKEEADFGASAAIKEPLDLLDKGLEPLKDNKPGEPSIIEPMS